MLVSLALLAPIVAVLYWIYLRTSHPGRRLRDYLWLLLIIVVVVLVTALTHLLVDSSDSSLWVYVLAPMVGYGALLTGLGLAFWLRRRS